jgi:hypothetical protein
MLGKDIATTTTVVAIYEDPEDIDQSVSIRYLRSVVM